MWVPKIPRRWDFCGCPPCGLCFDWIEPPHAPKIVEDNEPIIRTDFTPTLTGLQKMAEDLLGKSADQTTLEERVQVERAALEIHEQNILRAAKGEPKEPEGGATFQEIEEQKWFEAAVNQAGAARRAEKAYQEKLNKPKTLDQMDWGASEEAKGVEEEKKKKLAKEAEKEREKEFNRESLRRQKETEEAMERLRRKYDPTGYFR